MNTYNPANYNIRVAYHMRTGCLFAMKLICDSYNAVHATLKRNWRVCNARWAYQAGGSFLDIKLLKLIFPSLFRRIVNSITKIMTVNFS